MTPRLWILFEYVGVLTRNLVLYMLPSEITFVFKTLRNLGYQITNRHLRGAGRGHGPIVSLVKYATIDKPIVLGLHSKFLIHVRCSFPLRYCDRRFINLSQNTWLFIFIKHSVALTSHFYKDYEPNLFTQWWK